MADSVFFSTLGFCRLRVVLWSRLRAVVLCGFGLCCWFVVRNSVGADNIHVVDHDVDWFSCLCRVGCTLGIVIFKVSIVYLVK